MRCVSERKSSKNVTSHMGDLEVFVVSKREGVARGGRQYDASKQMVLFSLLG